MASLLEWANAYLDFCKSRFIHNTYQEKVKAFKFLFRSVSPQSSVADLSQGQILLHFSALVNGGRSGNAVNQDRKNLIAAWNWGCRYLQGFPKENPFLTERFPEVRCPRYVPPLSDFWLVLDKAESEQDRVLLLSYLYLAARRTELFRLQLDDVDLSRQRVRLSTRKRAGALEYDWLPVAEALLPELTAQVERVSDSGPWVFPNPRTGTAYFERAPWMPRLCGLAGVRPFGLHAIRHLTASILAQQNVPLVQIQQILRHKRLTTTERYIRSLGDCREAVSAIPRPPA